MSRGAGYQSCGTCNGYGMLEGADGGYYQCSNCEGSGVEEITNDFSIVKLWNLLNGSLVDRLSHA